MERLKKGEKRWAILQFIRVTEAMSRGKLAVVGERKGRQISTRRKQSTAGDAKEKGRYLLLGGIGRIGDRGRIFYFKNYDFKLGQRKRLGRKHQR